VPDCIRQGKQAAAAAMLLMSSETAANDADDAKMAEREATELVAT
jgi:hypothetical protein